MSFLALEQLSSHVILLVQKVDFPGGVSRENASLFYYIVVSRVSEREKI